MEYEVIEEELKCPYCNCDIETDESTDLGFEGDYCWIEMQGHCPECKTDFEWEEIYDFTRVQRLREI